MRPYRTVLEQKIRERRQTFEEFAAYVEEFAREHNEPATLSVRHLQRLVAGRRSDGRPLGPVQPATARLLEHILGMTIDELLAAPFAQSDDEAELRQRLGTSSRVDETTVATLRDQLSGIRLLDRQLGATVAHDEVLIKTTQVRGLLTYSLFNGTRERLAALLSELYCLAGWQALDLGKTEDSWRYYSEAVGTAQLSRMPSFMALAAAGRACVLTDIGETKRAVDVMENTCKEADQRCSRLLRSWLAAAYGETLAADRQHKSSIRAFHRAAALLPDATSDTSGPYVALDAVHLTRWHGHALARSGDPQAVGLLTKALDGLEPTFVRAEAALHVDLVIAHSTLSQLDEADNHAQVASTLAAQIGSNRQQRRLRLLRSHMQVARPSGLI
jgi:hypothetical protein